MRAVMVWYGTGINPPPATGLDDSDPRYRPTSWVGWSFNGVRFYSAYEKSNGEAVPFSIDGSPSQCPQNHPGTTCGDPGEPARFIQVAAVDISSDQHLDLCDSYPQSQLCSYDIYDPPDRAGGLLLYGSGRPYRKSGLLLAFIERGEIGETYYDPSQNKVLPAVHYWDGSGWSSSESDAVSITHPSSSPPCDDYKEPNYELVDTGYDTGVGEYRGCRPHIDPIWPSDSDGKLVFGEISAALIESGGSGSKIVLGAGNVFNAHFYPSTPWVYFWKTPFQEPWSGYFASPPPNADQYTKTSGYGWYIIDPYSEGQYDGDGYIDVWHTITVWRGGPNRPYGVYTGKEEIPW